VPKPCGTPFLFVRNKALDLRCVRRIGSYLLAKISLALCGLLVENVRFESMSALNLTVFGELKTLFCTAVRFDLRHY
jgi:hypothetical protein